jgi:hypothetical protein
MSEERDKEEEQGFSVTDKRRFDSDGEVRDDAPEREPREDSTTQGPEQALPEIDFSTFVLSLSTSVMVHLGEAPHPDGKTHKDLQLAKQTIDILGLLQEKTRGNLTDEEDKLMRDLLYDLRLRYVNAARS